MRKPSRRRQNRIQAAATSGLFSGRPAEGSTYQYLTNHPDGRSVLGDMSRRIVSGHLINFYHNHPQGDETSLGFDAEITQQTGTIDMYLGKGVKRSDPRVRTGLRHELGHAAYALRHPWKNKRDNKTQQARRDYAHELGAWRNGIQTADGYIDIPTLKKGLSSYGSIAQGHSRLNIKRLINYAERLRKAWITRKKIYGDSGRSH